MDIEKIMEKLEANKDLFHFPYGDPRAEIYMEDGDIFCRVVWDSEDVTLQELERIGKAFFRDVRARFNSEDYPAIIIKIPTKEEKPVKEKINLDYGKYFAEHLREALWKKPYKPLKPPSDARTSYEKTAEARWKEYKLGMRKYFTALDLCRIMYKRVSKPNLKRASAYMTHFVNLGYIKKTASKRYDPHRKYPSSVYEVLA